MNHAFIRSAALAVAASALLAACGGDDSPVAQTPTPTPPDGGAMRAPPDSASASSTGFLAFIRDLNLQNWDQSEPFDLSAFNAPTDNVDTSEPVATSIDAGA